MVRYQLCQCVCVPLSLSFRPSLLSLFLCMFVLWLCLSLFVCLTSTHNIPTPSVLHYLYVYSIVVSASLFLCLTSPHNRPSPSTVLKPSAVSNDIHPVFLSLAGATCLPSILHQAFTSCCFVSCHPIVISLHAYISMWLL